jgi:hypothetical protein
MDLECPLPVRCALLHARQWQRDISDGVEVDCASGHKPAETDSKSHYTGSALSAVAHRLLTLGKPGGRKIHMEGKDVYQMGEGRSPAGCDTLPINDVLEAQEKETGYEEE